MAALVTKRVEELPDFAELEDDDRLLLGRGEGPAGTTAVQALRAYLDATGVGGVAAEIATDAAATATSAAATVELTRILVQALAADAALITGVDVGRRTTLGSAKTSYVAPTTQLLMVDWTTTSVANKANRPRGGTYGRATRAEIDALIVLGMPAEEGVAWFQHATDRHLPDNSLGDDDTGGLFLILPDARGFAVSWFPGGIGDLVTDAGPAFHAAAKTAVAHGKVPSVYGQAGAQYWIATKPDLWYLRRTGFTECRIKVPTPDVMPEVPLELGGHALTGVTCDFRFGEIFDGTSSFSTYPSRAQISFEGVKSSYIELSHVNRYRLWANAARGAAFGSTAYNRVQLLGVVGLKEHGDAGGYSWVNGNETLGGRIMRDWEIKTGYGHNHNIGRFNQYEGLQCWIKRAGVYSSHLYDIRFETVPPFNSTTPNTGIECDDDTVGCIFISSWNGSVQPSDYVRPPIKFTNSGRGNYCFNQGAVLLNATRLFGLSPRTPLLATATDCAAPDPRIAPQNFGSLAAQTRAVLTPGLRRIGIPVNRFIGAARRLPVREGTVINFGGKWPGALIRPYVRPLDAAGKPFPDETGGAYIAMINMSWNSTNKHYSAGSNLTSEQVFPCVVMRPDVAFVDVGFFASTLAGAVYEVEDLWASLYTPPIGEEALELHAERISQVPTLDGVPTKGLAPDRFAVIDRSTGRTLYATAYETTLSVDLAAGNTTATLTAIGAVANGWYGCFLLDDLVTTHWFIVADKAGSSFTIPAIPAGRSAATGTPVYLMNWTPEAESGVTPAAFQADSAASDVAGVVADLNDLIAKLKAANLMEPE